MAEVMDLLGEDPTLGTASSDTKAKKAADDDGEYEF